MNDAPHLDHAALPSRYLDLIVSLARPIEIIRMPGAQSPGAYQAFVAGLQQAPAVVRMGGELDCLHVFLMVREWHALAGCTPREWVRGQLPFLQDYEIGGGHD